MFIAETKDGMLAAALNPNRPHKVSLYHIIPDVWVTNRTSEGVVAESHFEGLKQIEVDMRVDNRNLSVVQTIISVDHWQYGKITPYGIWDVAFDLSGSTPRAVAIKLKNSWMQCV